MLRTPPPLAAPRRAAIAVLTCLLLPCASAPAGAGRGDAPERPAVPRIKEKQAAAALPAIDEALAAARGDLAPDVAALADVVESWSALARPADERKKSPFARKKAKDAKGPSGPLEFPLPHEVMYAFGARDLLALDDAPKGLARAVQSARAIAVDELSAVDRVHALFHGVPAGYELALAGLMRSLDVLDAFDRYAEFLEAWRNVGPHGDESFYEALDRTAGTPEMVFFYDVMLGDFANKFARAESTKWNLEERHDHNQQCFLTYRQYRGLVEAVAWSLLLPPDEPLPHRIRRYDYDSVTAGYALRHQVDILVGFHGGPGPVVDEIAQFLRDNPPPEKPWDEYDPTGAFGAAFKARVTEMGAATGKSTDELGELARERRASLAQMYRAAAAATITP